MSVKTSHQHHLVPGTAASRLKRTSGPVEVVAQQTHGLADSVDSVLARVVAIQRRASAVSAQLFLGTDRVDWEEVEESELLACKSNIVVATQKQKIPGAIYITTPELVRKAKTIQTTACMPAARIPSTDTTPVVQEVVQAQPPSPVSDHTPSATTHQQHVQPSEFLPDDVKQKTAVADSASAVQGSEKIATQVAVQPSGWVVEAAKEPGSQTKTSKAKQSTASAVVVTEERSVLRNMHSDIGVAATHQQPWQVTSAATELESIRPLMSQKKTNSGEAGFVAGAHSRSVGSHNPPSPLVYSPSAIELGRHNNNTLANAQTTTTLSTTIESENAAVKRDPAPSGAGGKKLQAVRTMTSIRPALLKLAKRTPSLPGISHSTVSPSVDSVIISALEGESVGDFAESQGAQGKEKKNGIAKKVMKYLGRKLSKKESSSAVTAPIVESAAEEVVPQKSFKTVHPSSMKTLERAIPPPAEFPGTLENAEPEVEEKEQEQVAPVKEQPEEQGRRIETIHQDAVVPVQLPAKSGLPPRFWTLDFEPLLNLATGSFGKAVLCRYKKTGAPCVVKSVQKSDILRRNQQRQLLWEKFSMAALSQTDCPFVVKIYGSFLELRTANFVLEYVAGGELFSYMRVKRRLPEIQAKFYAAQVLLALEHMQKEHEIVYRDLKPENLLINYDGYLKMVDFGFAKQLKRTDRTYTQCGTMDYLSPEIILSKGHGYEVDMWAFGVLIFEMLAGDVPFKGENPYSLYANIIRGTFVMPDFFSPEAKSLISGLLAVDRMCRLGCGKNGISELRLHPFFLDVDFPAIRKKKILAPYLPPVMHAFDMQNFRDTASMLAKEEPMPELPERFQIMCEAIDQREFPGFDCVLSEPAL